MSSLVVVVGALGGGFCIGAVCVRAFFKWLAKQEAESWYREETYVAPIYYQYKCRKCKRDFASAIELIDTTQWICFKCNKGASDDN